MAEIAADVEKNGHLKTKFGQYAALATQGVIILRDALERAGTTDPEKPVKGRLRDEAETRRRSDGVALSSGRFVHGTTYVQ